jgi:hypothetical protein
MNEYEHKMLADRENRSIGAGVSLILLSPGFGIVAGAFLSSATALYVVTAVVAIFGVLAIAGGIKEKRERRRKSEVD